MGNEMAGDGEDWRVLGDTAYKAMDWRDAVRCYAKAKEAYASAVGHYEAASRHALSSSEVSAKAAAILAKYQK
jgi:hypothetical protein